MKKILVPTDFSKTASVALDVAADIAKKAGSELILLHVVEEAGGNSFNAEGQVSTGDMMDRLFTLKLIEKAKKQLEKTVQDPRYAAIDVNGELRVGNAFQGIRTIIAEHKVDLVVMGTSTHTKLEEMLIGTNTEKVVRTTKCPVLTVNKKPASTNFKNIVYATALAKDEEVFSRIVKRSQQLYNSTIHLVRINTPGDFQRDSVAKDAMDRFAKKLGLKNYTINVYNDLNVEEGIIRFADSVDSDLIAMATHGRTGFAHVIAGSVAEEVVSHAKRPVLTFVVKH
jgi:nucleotide-binding universal stress UspA family protein